MSIPEVGQGKVSIWPSFKGFRTASNAEVDGTTKEAASRFTKGFSSAGTSAGKGFSSGFKAATNDLTAEALKRAQDDVAKASRSVSDARIREADVTGKVRVAQSSLADAQRKYAADSTQVIRAEERLAAAQRAATSASSSTEHATERLTAARRELVTATTAATSSASGFGSAWRRSGSDSASGFFGGFRSTMFDVFGGVLGANLVTGIGYTIGRSIGSGITAGFEYSLQGIGLASALEQSEGAVASVFKESSGLIVGYSENAAKAVGISQSAYLKYATVVGAQLKNLGVRTDQVAPKTSELITLGADLAAQFGGSTSDAVAALSSLLRGERDPIERYGVGLKQVDINSRLAAWGMSGLTGEAEKQATIQATLALLWEQTADAQGTFNRESDTFAHKQQVALALVEQTQTKFGAALLPGATAALSFVNDNIIPEFDGFLERIGPDLAAAMDTSGPKVQAFITDSLIPLGEQWADQAEEGIPAFIDGLSDVTDAIATLTDADNPLDGFVKDAQDWLNGDNDRGLGGDFAAWVDSWMTTDFLLPKARDLGKEWATEISGGFTQGFEGESPEAVAAAGDYVTNVTDALTDQVNIERLRRFGALSKAEYAAAMTSTFGSDAVELAGFSLTKSVADGMSRGNPSILAEAIAARTGTLGILGGPGFLADMDLAGDLAARGFAKGLTKGTGAVGLAGKALAEEAVGSIRKGLDMHSPSRVLEADGGLATRSFAGGMLGELRSVSDAAALLAAATRTGLVGVAASSAAGTSGSSGAFPTELTLVVDGRPMRAYIAEGADARISAYDTAAASAVGVGSKSIR